MINIVYILAFFSVTIFFFVIIDVVSSNYRSMQDHLHANQAERQGGLDALLSSKSSQHWISICLGVVGGVCGFIVFGVTGAVGGGLLGAWIPLLIARIREKNRLKKIELQLVPALNLLSNSVQSGKTLLQALEEVSININYPMSSELSLIARQVRVGLSQEKALNDFSERVPLQDIGLTVQAMIVSLKTGANLPRAIKLISESVMNRMQVESKIKVLTTQGKAQGFVLGMAPFGILAVFYLMSPDYASLMFTETTGQMLLVLVVILDAIAMYWIRVVTSIDV